MSFDCALFDVDGVLVDIRRSYNAAIKKTVSFCLHSLSDIRWRGLVDNSLIARFRQGGGFNNDTDTSYAIILALLASRPKTAQAARKFLGDIAGAADETGIRSVENQLSAMGYEISKHRDALSYPGSVKESLVARVFDEFFYGPRLFSTQNRLEPKYWDGSKPLIENDRVIVTAGTLKSLCATLNGNLAMVTGRSRVAAEYSLGRLMKHFDLGACVFLEDEKREYAKPDPYAIVQAMSQMGAKSAIYAGDSTEDLLMARRAESGSRRIKFVGIYGASANPAKSRKRFLADPGVVPARSVNMLPKIIAKMH